MADFIFESGELNLSFDGALRCHASVASYRWDVRGGHPCPDIADRSIGWSLATGQTPFECYAESMANRMEPISSRIPDFAEHWRRAKGLMWVPDGEFVQIFLAAPSDPGFTAFLVGAFAAKLRLIVAMEANFATGQPAPGPSPVDFLERREPLFMSAAPRFSVHQPDGIIERRGEGKIERHGIQWIVPPT